MNDLINSVFGSDLQTPLHAVRWVTMVLWGGLAVVTVTLFILMRTRWGEAKPLSKCVALSLLAHVLFGAYAYGTRLFLDVPPGPNKDVVHLTVLDPSSIEVEADASEDSAPWDELADTTRPTGVELPSAERMSSTVGELPAESDSEAAAQSPEAPQFAIGADDAGVVRKMPVDGIGEKPREAVPDVPEAKVNDSVVGAAPIDTPSPEAVEPQLIASTPAPLPQVERASTDADVGLEAMAADTPLQAPQIETAIQQLAEAAMESRRPEARVTDLDHLQRTGVHDMQSPSPVAPSAVAARALPAWSPSISSGGQERPAPRRLGDGQVVPPIYRARVPDLRLTIAKQHGGSEDTEAAVDGALQWIVAQQLPDGRWSASQHGGGREAKVLGHDRHGAGAKADTAVTGLAVLALLAAGNTHYEGDYRKTVQTGLEYLIANQRSDGCMAGDARLFARMYCHGMASLAVSEAFAMTGDQRLKQYVERSVRYSVTAQDGFSGGWRYQVGDRGGDMSQFGWQVMALKSAELADVVIPLRTKDGMQRFLAQCEQGQHGGLAAYRPQARATPTMTAEALSCRFFLNQDTSHAQRREAKSYLLQHLPGSSSTPNYYYWYYGTLAMFQNQGDGWQRWNDALVTELLQRQVPATGELAGSFPPDSVWGGYGGRVYTTAMATLCLEVYYRYLPLMEEHEVAGRPLMAPGHLRR